MVTQVIKISRKHQRFSHYRR